MMINKIHEIVLRILIIVSVASSSFASDLRLPPMQKKNINQVTDLFPKEVKDKAQIEAMVNQSKSGSETTITNKSVLSVLPDSGKFEGAAAELGSLNQSEAENKGLTIRAENNEIWNKAYINYDDSMVKRHKQDADRIAHANKNFVVRLVELLKEKLDVDCKQTKGPEDRDSQMFVEIEAIPQKEVVYDKFYCEHLMNSYNCFDDISLQCLQFAEKTAQVSISGSSMNYRTSIIGGSINRYSFEGSYGSGLGVSRAGGGKAHGFMHKSSSSTYHASEGNWQIGLNVVTNIATINRLHITGLQYGMFIMIKVNGSVLFVGPTGGNNLFQNGHRVVETKGKKKYGGKFGKRATITTYYPQVNTGYANYAMGLDGIASSSSSHDINLLPLIRQGYNTIDIKAISLDGNRVSFNIDVSERICLNWRENWTETCTLRITQP